METVEAKALRVEVEAIEKLPLPHPLFQNKICCLNLSTLFLHFRNINRGKVCQKPDVLEEPVKLHSWWRFWYNEEKKLEKQSNLPDQCQPRDSDINDKSLGATSLSSFGIFGTVLEVLVIFYLTIASVVGLYHLPGFRRLRPELRETTMTKLIMNCLVVQLLSSSLPVLSRVLGEYSLCVAQT